MKLLRTIRLDPSDTFVFDTALEKEARYVRQRSQEAVGLLVVVDGDQVGRRGRLDQIQEVLRLAGFETKDKMPDRIAACIPNIAALSNVPTTTLGRNR